MSSLFGRSIDYGKLLGQVALSKVAPTNSIKQATEKALAQKLLELRGAPTKISQILSMKGDEEQQNLRRKSLQEIPAIPLESISHYLEDYAGHLSSQIESISSDAQAASLGQVHKVKLRNSTKDFALKVQYPDAREIMTVDQGLFKLITKTFDSFKEGFSLQEYHDFIKEELLRELNYSQEVQTQKYFEDFFQRHPQITIPKPYPELSGEGHIVMDFEEAYPIDEFLEIANQQQITEARKLISTFYLESLFLLGIIHSDPNPGNINFRINNSGKTELVVYDFGATQQLSMNERIALLKLIENSNSPTPQYLAYFAELGFDSEALHTLGNKLNAFCEVIFEPFNSVVKYDLNKWKRAERSKAILADQRFTFMTAAPSSFLPSMRLFQGLFFYLNKLGNEAFFTSIIRHIKTQLSSEINSYSPPRISIHEAYQNAQNLCISVTENGVEKVGIKLPRKAVENLDDFIDKDLRAKITEQKIAISELVQRARSTAYSPQDLLDIRLESKNIKISLK